MIFTCRAASECFECFGHVRDRKKSSPVSVRVCSPRVPRRPPLPPARAPRARLRRERSAGGGRASALDPAAPGGGRPRSLRVRDGGRLRQRRVGAGGPPVLQRQPVPAGALAGVRGVVRRVARGDLRGRGLPRGVARALPPRPDGRRAAGGLRLRAALRRRALHEQLRLRAPLRPRDGDGLFPRRARRRSTRPRTTRCARSRAGTGTAARWCWRRRTDARPIPTRWSSTSAVSESSRACSAARSPRRSSTILHPLRLAARATTRGTGASRSRSSCVTEPTPPEAMLGACPASASRGSS